MSNRSEPTKRRADRGLASWRERLPRRGSIAGVNARTAIPTLKQGWDSVKRVSSGEYCTMDESLIQRFCKRGTKIVTGVGKGLTKKSARSIGKTYSSSIIQYD